MEKKTEGPQVALQKIRPLISHFIKVSQSLYDPESKLTIDESMVKYNGRSKFRVYMPLKPIKYGFKAYVLTEATSGYLINWDLHQGKKKTVLEIVQGLVSNLKSTNYLIAMDRFYSTIDVAEYLNDAGFRMVGTIMKNRTRLEEGQHIQIKFLEKGESIFYFSKNKKFLLTVWKDSSAVHIISNVGNTLIGEVERRSKEAKETGYIQTITCPNNVKLYSSSSRGVDKLDQMISYYNMNIKSRKWYVSIVGHWLEIAMYNSYIIFTKSTQQKISFLKYQQSVIKSLISGKREQRKILPTPQRLSLKSAPIILELSEEDCKFGYKGGKNRCKICQAQNQVKITSYECKTHNIAVCILNCYDIHRKNLHI